MKQLNSLKFVFLLGALLSPVFAMAWWHGPPPPTAPLDGGLSILLVAGAGLGVKKYISSVKKNHTTEK
jgi:hypothetical protein